MAGTESETVRLVPQNVEEAERIKRRTIRIILATVFFGSCMYTIVLPSIPYYLIKLKAEEYYLGWLVSAFSIGQFIAAPPMGSWYNQKNAYQPLIFSSLLLIVGNVGYSIAWNKWILVASRLVIGMGAANVSVCRAYCAAVTTQEERVAIFSLISACQGVALIIGPALGSALSFINISVWGGLYTIDEATAPGIFSTLLCIINLALIVCLFQEGERLDQVTTGPVRRRRNGCCKGVHPDIDLVAVNASMFIFFLIVTCFAIFETILSKIAKDLYGWGATRSGVLFACAGVMSIAAFMAIKPINRRLSDRNLLLLGMAIMASAAAACLQLNSNAIPLPQFLIGAGLFSIGYPFASALSYAMFSKILGTQSQGTMMGWLTSSGSVARTVGPLLSSYGYYLQGTFAVYALIGGISVFGMLFVLLCYQKLLPYEELLEKKLARKGYKLGDAIQAREHP